MPSLNPDGFRPLLDLSRQNQRPAAYPDGSTDSTTRALDVIADALAAPARKDSAAPPQ